MNTILGLAHRAAALFLLCAFFAPPLDAAPMPVETLLGWRVAQPAGANPVTLRWDLWDGKVPGQYVQGLIQFPAGTSQEDMAQQLADQVNQVAQNEFGLTVNVATALPGTSEVILKPGWWASMGKGTTKLHFKLRSDARPVLEGIPVPSLDNTKLSIQPDPESGVSALSELGNFGVESSLGSSNFFMAPVGTTNVELAQLFAASIDSLPGYSAFAVGHEVIMTAPVDTQTYFLVDGEPFEYQIGAVPEPTTSALCGIGLVALVAVARRSRSSFGVARPGRK